MESESKEKTEAEWDQSKIKKYNWFLLGGIALVVLIGGYITLSSSKISPKESKNPPVVNKENPKEATGETRTVENVPTSPEVARIINVEGGSYYFRPNEIRLKKGETVRIVFSNVSGKHNFVIDELNVKTPITQTGEKVEVEFTPDKVGEFEFYCSVANHRELGMVGTLIVE